MNQSSPFDLDQMARDAAAATPWHGAASPTLTTYTTEPCQLCGQATTLRLPVDVVKRLGLVPVQDLLPEADPEQRELIRHGTHPGCWRNVFGPSPELIEALEP